MIPSLIRKGNYAVADYLARVTGMERTALRLRRCRHDESHGKFLHCHSAYCILCNRFKAIEESKWMTAKLLGLKTRHPKARLLFATATLQPCTRSAIRQRAIALTKGWNRLNGLKHPHDDVRMAIRDLIDGGFRWLEVSRDPEDSRLELVHTHSILVMRPSYAGRNHLRRDAWFDLWRQSAHDLARSLDAQPVKSVEAVCGYMREEEKFRTAAVLAIEHPARYYERARQLAGLRRYLSWGMLADLHLTETHVQTGLYRNRHELRRAARRFARTPDEGDDIPIES